MISTFWHQLLIPLAENYHNQIVVCFHVSHDWHRGARKATRNGGSMGPINLVNCNTTVGIIGHWQLITINRLLTCYPLVIIRTHLSAHTSRRLMWRVFAHICFSITVSMCVCVGEKTLNSFKINVLFYAGCNENKPIYYTTTTWSYQTVICPDTILTSWAWIEATGIAS